MNRVLFLSWHLPKPDEAGAGRPWAEVTMLRSSGYPVTVVTAGAHYLTGSSTRNGKGGLWNLESASGVDIIRTYVPSDFRRSIRRRLAAYAVYSILALLRGIRTKARFVFVGTDPIFIVVVAYALSLWHRADLVLDERDLYPDTAVALGYLRPGILCRCMEIWQKIARRRARKIIAATPGIRDMLIEKGVIAEKITVLPNAFPPGESDTITACPSQNASDFVVLYAGGMGQANELLTILRAAEMVSRDGLKIQFVFIGEGERKAEYERHCEDAGLHNCLFLSALPRNQVTRLLHSATVCVHSLKANPFWRCALSSKVFDYLAYGKPVIFAGEGDIAQLLSDAGAGITVPAENPEALAAALRLLYESPALVARMGQGGAEYVRQHYSVDAQTARLMKAFAV